MYVTICLCVFLFVCLFVCFFFNPTKEVVIVHPYGWCVLGMLLLLVFTLVGHEYQDLFNGMHACTD